MSNPPITAEERRIVSQIDGHFCYDWDGLPVSAWTYEYDCCVDFKKTLLGRIVNWFVMKKFYRQERKTRARALRERLDTLYTEKHRLENRLYELRSLGDYMAESGNQERAVLPGPAKWVSYWTELAATRAASRDNQIEIASTYADLFHE